MGPEIVIFFSSSFRSYGMHEMLDKNKWGEKRALGSAMSVSQGNYQCKTSSLGPRPIMFTAQRFFVQATWSVYFYLWLWRRTIRGDASSMWVDKVSTFFSSLFLRFCNPEIAWVRCKRVFYGRVPLYFEEKILNKPYDRCLKEPVGHSGSFGLFIIWREGNNRSSFFSSLQGFKIVSTAWRHDFFGDHMTTEPAVPGNLVIFLLRWVFFNSSSPIRLLWLSDIIFIAVSWYRSVNRTLNWKFYSSVEILHSSLVWIETT